MKLYNKNKNKVEDLSVIVSVEGTFYVNKLDDVTLNSLGYYKTVSTSPLNRRYYLSTSQAELIDNIYTYGYYSVERDLEGVKKAMLKDLSTAFKAKIKRPIVDTGLGYSIDGGRDDLTNFVIGKEFGFPLIKDYEGNDHPATTLDYDKAILAIKTYGVTKYQEKWFKEAEINALATVEDCILYEATPYTELVDDVDENTLLPTGTQTLTTLYKNNVTDW